MADYPDWVMKYKEKGIYIKKTKNGYSLYRGHSERVAGKKYPVLKCDEYLGLVTENDGLMPSKPPVKLGVMVRTYGVEHVAEICSSILRVPLRKKGQDALLLYSHALLPLCREDNPELYSASILSLWFGDIGYRRKLTYEEEETVGRLRKQIKAKLEKALGKDSDEAIALLGTVYAVFVNERWVLSDIPSRLDEILRAHSLKLMFEETMNYGN